MKKITAIILLASFFAAQYARQLSYLECTVKNYYNSTAERCDCEKLLTEKQKTTDPLPLATHTHIHSEEIDLPSRGISRGLAPDIFPLIYPTPANAIGCAGMRSRIDHPPQIFY